MNRSARNRAAWFGNEGPVGVHEEVERKHFDAELVGVDDEDGERHWMCGEPPFVLQSLPAFQAQDPDDDVGLGWPLSPGSIPSEMAGSAKCRTNVAQSVKIAGRPARHALSFSARTTGLLGTKIDAHRVPLHVLFGGHVTGRSQRLPFHAIGCAHFVDGVHSSPAALKSGGHSGWPMHRPFVVDHARPGQQQWPRVSAFCTLPGPQGAEAGFGFFGAEVHAGRPKSFRSAQDSLQHVLHFPSACAGESKSRVSSVANIDEVRGEREDARR